MDECDGTCTNTVGSYECGCNSGFLLTSDERTCRDIDECGSGNGGCSQLCTNTVGSFICGCRQGFRLQPDDMSCARKFSLYLCTHVHLYISFMQLLILVVMVQATVSRSVC